MDRIQIRCEGHIGWITLNHPEKRNALSDELVKAVIDGLARLAKESCRAVVRAVAPSARRRARKARISPGLRASNPASDTVSPT